MRQVTLTCNLCTATISHTPLRGGRGLSIDGNGGWTLDERGETEKSPIHLCYRCLASIAALKVCRHGIEGCGGGMKCTSDHK